MEKDSKDKIILKMSKGKLSAEDIDEHRENAKQNRKKQVLSSAGQLLEIKHVILTNLTEIKDLRGDSEFLLRKSKAVSDLARLWLDIVKEEG